MVRICYRHQMIDETLTFSSVNSGGRAALSDGTVWRVPPAKLGEMNAWQPGVAVKVDAQDHPIWPHRLLNLETGAAVSVIPSAPLGPSD